MVIILLLVKVCGNTHFYGVESGQVQIEPAWVVVTVMIGIMRI